MIDQTIIVLVIYCLKELNHQDTSLVLSIKYQCIMAHENLLYNSMANHACRDHRPSLENFTDIDRVNNKNTLVKSIFKRNVLSI